MININKIEDIEIIILGHRITGPNVSLSAEAEQTIIHFMVDDNWEVVKEMFYNNNLDAREIALRARLRQGENPTAAVAQAADIAMFSAIAADMIDEFYQIVDHYGVNYWTPWAARFKSDDNERFDADAKERAQEMKL